MAWLRVEDGSWLPLPARLVVGRSSACGWRLAVPAVSGEHATLYWGEGAWQVRDLGSRNGTFVNFQRVPVGEARALKQGDVLGFGGSHEHAVLLDAGAPGPLARDLSNGRLVGAQEGVLALPAADQPTLSVYADRRGRWVVEAQNEPARAAEDGELLVLGEARFQLVLPVDDAGTAAVDGVLRLDALGMRFVVSGDGQRVDLSLVHANGELALEPREHLVILLALARARLEDAASGAPAAGWRDRDALLRQLRLDPNGLDVAIFRARGQLSAAQVEGAADVVEVRRGQRRLGVDASRVQIREA